MNTAILLIAAGEQLKKLRTRRLTTSQSAAFAAQSGVPGMSYLTNGWTEEKVLALPPGQEHNALERKSGALFEDEHELKKELAKTLSAFANSGGGHIVLGQKDKTLEFDGVPPKHKKSAKLEIHEWIDQIIRNLLQVPLTSYRVHKVVRDCVGSKIPSDKEVLVIDVGDSRLAPHQAAFPTDAPQYYYRVGSRSLLAPHHYLELLRTRLTAAVLEPKVAELKIVRAIAKGGENILRFDFRFVVQNSSHVATHEWAVKVEFSGGEWFVFDSDLFSGPHGVSFNNTILPTMARSVVHSIGIRIDPLKPLESELAEIISQSTVHFIAISETHVGQEYSVPFASVLPINEAITAARELLRKIGMQL